VKLFVLKPLISSDSVEIKSRGYIKLEMTDGIVVFGERLLYRNCVNSC
jgi:hypothetical protein